ncbi:O-antigen ligase family protein [Persephonella hydrogeniphila]|nr:O-antigen ligase family protein [Persephonella hydrogeniphila]
MLFLTVLFKNLNAFRTSANVLMLWLISLSIGSFFIFVGIINSNPGAVSSITVILLWPLLYLIITGFICEITFFNLINKVFIFSSFLIPAYGLYYLLGNARVIPSNLFVNVFPEDIMQGIGLYEGYIEVSIPNFSSLFFLGPFILTNFLIERNKKKKFLYGILLLFITIIVLLSGRRTLLLIFALSFLIVFIFILNIKDRYLKKQLMVNYIKNIALGIIFIVISYFLIARFYDIDLSVIVENLEKALSFGSSTDPSTIARYEQFFALIDGFSENPLFGQGFGAVASVIRSEEQPWAYELFYVALLFHAGIIGFFVYALLTFWIIWQGIKILKNYINIKYMLPYLTGTISFLLASASNPYLTKFDYMWIIFIPIMYINYYFLYKKRYFEDGENLNVYTKYSNS